MQCDQVVSYLLLCSCWSRSAREIVVFGAVSEVVVLGISRSCVEVCDHMVEPANDAFF